MPSIAKAIERDNLTYVGFSNRTRGCCAETEKMSAVVTQDTEMPLCAAETRQMPADEATDVCCRGKTATKDFHKYAKTLKT